MNQRELQQLFVDAVTEMAKNPSQAKKTYHKAMLKLHPDKQRTNATKELARALSPKLTGIYSMLGDMPGHIRRNLSNPRFVSNLSSGSSAYDPSTMSSINMATHTPTRSRNNRGRDPNYSPSNSNSNNNNNVRTYGERFRPYATFDPKNKTRTRRASDPNSNTLYKHVQTTNPVLFKRHILSKIPKKYRPCPPGEQSGGRDCQSVIEPRVTLNTATKHYQRFGDSQYWIGTEHGRRAIAHAISKIQSTSLRNKLKNKARELGFDVDYELKRTRPKMRSSS